MEKPVPDVYVRLARKLAHVDKEERDKGVEKVKTFLTRQKNMTHLEWMKLWKGLYYCMWHSDKPQVQEELASNLSAMVHLLPWQEAIPFLRAFYETMCREWRGIDRLRLDKFYNLMRCVMLDSFVMLKNHDWNGEVIVAFLDMMERHVLVPAESQPASVVMHVAQYWLKDMEQAVCSDPKAATKLCAPLINLLHLSSSDPIIKRIMDTFVEPLTESNPMGIRLNRLGRLAFELGADPKTPQRNRKALYQVRGKFCRDEILVSKKQPKEKAEPDVAEPSRHAEVKKRPQQLMARGKIDKVVPHVPLVRMKPSEEDQEEQQQDKKKKAKLTFAKQLTREASPTKGHGVVAAPGLKKKQKLDLNMSADELLVRQQRVKKRPTPAEVESPPEMQRQTTPSSLKSKLSKKKKVNVKFNPKTEVRRFDKNESPQQVNMTKKRRKSL